MSRKYINQSSNYNKLFNNPEFIGTLLSNVRNKMQRQLMKTEQMYILTFLKNIDPVIFEQPPNVIMNMLIKQITEKFAQHPCYDEPTDIHELLKTEIGASTEDIDVASDVNFTSQITNNFANSVDVQSIFGSKTFNDLKNIFTPGAVKKTAYALLDTRYRVLDNDGRDIIKWNVTSNTTTVQGSVNIVGDIQNITAIRTFPMRMPYNAQADNDYQRVTMFIQEFSAQSFIAQENRRYHFMYEMEVHDRWIDLKAPRDADCIYKFRTPLSRIDSININFGSPLQAIKFDTDRRNMLVTAYGPLITLVSTDPHNLETGDLIYITYFTTGNPNADQPLISTVGNLDGVVATYVDDLTITIPANGAYLQSVGAGTISVTNNDINVIGVGTSFFTLFVNNDIIEILGIKYAIQAVTSNTTLTLKIVYAGVTAAGLAYSKNNTLPGMNPSVYFGSKRMFIPMEFEYLDSSY